MVTARHVQALGRASWVIVLAAFLGSVVGYGLFTTATPKYAATTQLVVGYASSQQADEVGARLLASERAGALVQIAGTDPVVSAATTAAGVHGVHPTVTALGSSSSSLITITVVDSNGVAAAQIANAYKSILLPQLVDLVGPLDSQVRLQTVNPAVTPTKPFSPNRTRYVGLGFLAGLMLGIVTALFMDALSRKVRDSDEIAELTGLTILGTVPRHDANTQLPAHSTPRSVRAEAYRQVRTTLLNLQPAVQVVAITSAVQGEGKTSLTTNVATTIRRAGHRVVVVDADLRRPMAASVFGAASRSSGLSDVLAGKAQLHDVIWQADESLPAVVTAGPTPPNPSELLASAAFVKVLSELRAEFEYVLVDTTPILPVTDALVIAPLVDGVVVVTKVGTTTSDRLKRALAALERVQAKVLGIVPNCAAPRGVDRYYRYGYASPDESADQPKSGTASRRHRAH